MKKISNKHLHLFIAFYYVALALSLVLLIGLKIVHRPNWFLGLNITLAALPEFLLFFIDYEFKNKIHYCTVILAVLAIAAGIVFISNSTISVSTICIVWGILDILIALNQMFLSCLELKKNKTVLLKIAIDIMVIVVGILLCIHLEEGLMFHLVMLGVSLFLFSLFEFIQFKFVKKGFENEDY